MNGPPDRPLTTKNRGFFFSRNIGEEVRQDIRGILGVFQALNTGRYLGLPSLIGREKRTIFNYIKERLWRKLQGWRGRKISKAGKEVLIKSAAQAIPSYCMTTFLLPTTLLDELHIMLNKFWWENGGEGSKGIKWMRWERVCVRNEAGGRGFRDLHAFNLAMLGKMAWRLVKEPDTFVCKLLKAKYFPNSGFEMARMGNNPSFTWYSIHASQALIVHGCRWKVGTGENIRVWNSAWINDDESFTISSHCPPGLEELRVSELVVGGSRIWNRQLLEGVLSPMDVDRITRTPLTPSGVENTVIWHWSRDGMYSVKTGYNLVSRLCHDQNLESPGNWRMLWKLAVPPKVKDFLWRSCKDCLPTKVNLYQKRSVNNKTCVLCGYVEETMWHIFVNCPFARACWNLSGFLNQLEGYIVNVDGFSDLIFNFLSSGRHSMVESIATLLWQVWKQRDSKVWTGSCLSPAETVHVSVVALHEWRAARSSRSMDVATPQMNTIPVCRAWHPPTYGTLKLSVDAAFFVVTNQMGIGMIIRDDSGSFILSRTRVLKGRLDVEVGEAMGFHEALSWVQALGLEEVSVEGDSKLVVDAIASSKVSLSVFGDYVRLCKNILLNNPSYSVVFVRRDANLLAHEFARNSLSFGSSFCWLDPPEFVDGLPTTVCSCNNTS